MPVKSMLNDVRMSPRKVGEVAALVRGRSVSDAITILDHTPRRAAEVVKQAIVSARANAEHNHSYKPDSLIITEIYVTHGARLKRFRPAARGRALKFERKSSHIRVLVDGEKRVIKKAVSAAKEEAKK